MACFNGMQEIRYEENYNCIIENDLIKINKANNKDSPNSNLVFNNENNTLSYNISKKDEVIEYYFKNIKGIKSFDQSNFKTKQALNINESILNIADSEIYILNDKEKKHCTPEIKYDYTDNSIFLLIIGIPVLYFLTATCLIVFICKYKKVNGEYHRLRQEVDKLDLSSQETENKNNNINNNNINNNTLNYDHPDHLDLTENNDIGIAVELNTMSK